MSIDRTQPLQSVSNVQSREANDNAASAKVRQTTAKPETTQTGAQVTLSDAQSLLTQPGHEDINIARVEQIKTAIRNGELKTDTGKIADALIAETKAYLNGD